MALTPDGKAPYAPPPAVFQVIERFRDLGLQTPFTLEVLERAGVKESIAPRTLQTLKLLEFLDDEGQPTSQFDQLRFAPTGEWKARLADMIRETYAVIFQFADPAQDAYTQVEDAFRTFKPLGQRARMVTLFYALCEYANIIDEVPQAQRGAINRTLKERGASKGYSPKARQMATKNSEGKRAKRSSQVRSGEKPNPLPPPVTKTSIERYVELLLTKAEQGDTDPALLDRIERALGVSEASASNKGEADSN